MHVKIYSLYKHTITHIILKHGQMVTMLVFQPWNLGLNFTIVDLSGRYLPHNITLGRLPHRDYIRKCLKIIPWWVKSIRWSSSEDVCACDGIELEVIMTKASIILALFRYQSYQIMHHLAGTVTDSISLQ